MNLNESQFRELIDRYLNGTASLQEAKIVEDFFASYIGENPGEDAASLMKTRQQILQKINQKISSQKRPAFFGATVWKVAAAISLIMVSLWFLSRTELNPALRGSKEAVAIKTETTKRGEKAILELPDGTKVHLNANSSITYPVTFKDARTISLVGEAYFEVTHDASRPFIVQTRSSAVNVLGTSFNVNARPETKVEVTLVTGKVKVNSATQESSLEPGYQAIVTDGNDNIRKVKVNVADFISWKDNVLVFRDASLEEAVAILEEWYDAKIKIHTSLKACTISGEYKNESLENVIRSFEFLLNAKADFADEKNITLTGSGCKLN
jgi:transmembrane sensor